MNKSVREVMHEGVVTCAPDEKLRDVLKRMSENHIRSIVVTDSDCGLNGIVSQTDLVEASVQFPDVWSDMLVRAIMTEKVLTVPVSASANDAAKVLIENRVHRLIVVDADGCTAVGVLAMSDIVRGMMDEA
jgi:CBS domain-containing protein